MSAIIPAPCRHMLAARRVTMRTVARPAFQTRARRAPVVTKALFGGQGGGLDMSKLMENVKKAQQLVQTETAKVQQELANTEFDGYDEEETVRVVMTGNQEPKCVEITQAAVDAGTEELSRRITLAMKEAHTKSVAGMKEKMKELASSLGLPNPNQLNL